MNFFLKKCGILLLPIVVLMYPLDLLLSYNLKRSSAMAGEFEVWNDIYEGKASCDLAVYGSSRAWVQFNTKIIEDSLFVNAYNFGLDGHNFWLQYYRHLVFFENNEHPKTIILSVDISALEKRPELFNMNQFLPYMLWNKKMYEYTSSYQGPQLIDYFIPLVRYTNRANALEAAYKYALGRDTARYRYKGYKGQEVEWNDDLNKAKEKIGSYAVNLDSASVELLKQFLSECKAKGIEVIFVYAPEHIDGQKFISNRQIIKNILSDIAKTHNLLYLDYSNSYLCYDKKYFYNSMHMNAKGANLFTSMMVHDIKEARKIGASFNP